MKKFILNFKQTIRFTTSVIASREFAFIYCILGTIAQVSHTYFLVNSISSYDGTWKTAQAVMISIFISSSLLYFTAVADNDDTAESRKIHLAVTLFTIIEILINIYYYSRHLIIDNPNYQIFDFVFAVLVSCLIPVTIKLYSSHIRAKEWIIAIENDQEAFVTDFNSNKEKADDSTYEIALDEDKIKEIVSSIFEDQKQEIEDLKQKFEENIDNPEVQEKINKLFSDKLKTFDADMTKSFEKHGDLFMTQFENKMKLIIKQKTEEISK